MKNQTKQKQNEIPKLRELDYGQKVKYWLLWILVMFPVLSIIDYFAEVLFNNIFQRIFCASMILMGYLLGGFGGRFLDNFILKSVSRKK